MTNFLQKELSVYRIIIFIVILLFCIPNLSFGQRKWIKEAIERSDSLTVDTESSAWILVNDHQIEISKDGRAKRKIKKAVKLLNLSGKEYMTLFEHISSWKKIENIKGWHIKSDGEVVKLKKKNIAQIASDLSAGYYSDAMIYMAAFTGVKTGDIVAFEYSLVEETNWGSYFQSFNIQVQQPVMFAKFHVKIPKGWELYIGSHFAQVCSFEGKSNEFTWIAEDLQYQPNEELMPPWYFMTRNIEVSCFNPNETKDHNFKNWKDAAIWIRETQDEAVEPNQEIIEYVNQHIDILPDREQKLKAISEFVRDEIRYVAVEIGKGRIIPRNASKTFYNRYGDCKDKVALMRSMLQLVNIPSIAVLASVNSYVDSRLPSPFQFDHCIIGINVDSIPDVTHKPNATINGWLFYDPTDQAQRLGELPPQLYGSKILIGDNIDSALIKVPYISPEKNHRKYIVMANLDDKGKMSSAVTIVDYGSKALATKHLLSNTENSKMIDFYQKKYSKSYPAVKLTDFFFNSDIDSTWIQFRLEQNDYITKSGDLCFIPIDFIYEGRLPVLKKKERIHPIWFGGFKKIDVEIDWDIDESWKIEFKPDSIQAKCEVVTYTSDSKMIGNNISIKSSYESGGGIIDKGNYKDARKFRKSLSKSRSMMLKLISTK